MKIVLVRPDSGSRFQINPPLSLGYLSAGLKRYGYTDVSLVDATLDALDPSRAAVRVLALYPRVVGVQVYLHSEDWTRTFTRLIRELQYPDRPIVVCGGPSVSARPLTSLCELGCDYVVWGEGENVLPRLLEDLSIYGKHCYPGDRIIHAAPIDVNDIPIPDWELIQPQRYFEHMQPLSVPLRGKRPAPIITSRGCPHRCAFCAASVVHGHEVRMRKVENIIEEIRLLRDKYDVDEIFFSDDNIMHDRARAHLLFTHLGLMGMHWRAPNGIRYENAEDSSIFMTISGCYYVGMGIESGSARMQREIHKPINMPRMRRVVGQLQRQGIMVSGFYISGLPGETWSDRIASVLSAWRIGFDRIQVSPFTPLPGSELANAQPRKSTVWNMVQTLVFYIHPRIIWSLARNIRWSQARVFWNHPFVKMWTGR